MATANEDSVLMAEVFEKTPSAYIILDRQGKIAKANEAAHLLLGLKELTGRRWVQVIEEVFRPRRDDGHEISTRDGRRLSVATRALSCGQLVQMTDLTETRHMQDKISHMERLSSLGRMAATLAHQIRTPLSAAMLYAANLGNPRLNALSRSAFQQKLMSRLQDLEAQVSDVLMFARSGEQTASEVDAVDVVEAAAQNAVSVVSKAGAELITDLGERPMPLWGNASALTGALSNLVNNAVEAGASRVRISLKREKGVIAISVANNGPAIEPALRDKIFEPFFTSKSHGTGLGLAVVSAVAKVHQGEVSLSSEEDYATVFTLRLPVAKKKSEPRRPSAFVRKVSEGEENAAA